jgi:hypothetical protein
MLQRADPALIRAAHEARRDNHDLLLVELPFADPTKGTGYFLFRGMGYAEFDAFAKDAQLGDITDILVEEFLLWPKTPEWEKNPIHEVEAGSFEETAVMLVKLSGFDEKRSLLEAQAAGRALASSPFSAAQMFICKAFPGMKPAEVARLGVQETFRLIGMAEQMLSQNGEPLQFPLRDFFNDGRKQRSTSQIPKDFSRLPVLTPDQIMELQGEARLDAVRETIRRRREANVDPDNRSRRMMEARRRKMDELAMRRTGNMRQSQAEADMELRREIEGG